MSHIGNNMGLVDKLGGLLLLLPIGFRMEPHRACVHDALGTCEPPRYIGPPSFDMVSERFGLGSWSIG